MEKQIENPHPGVILKEEFLDNLLPYSYIIPLSLVKF